MEFLVGLIVLLVLFVRAQIKERSERKAANQDLDQWAENLDMVRVGDELFGTLYGVPVGARLALDAPKLQEACSTVYARLQPPLDLGLTVHPREANVEDPGEGHRIVATGDVDLDERFAIRGDEPSRVLALLTPRLRRQLVQRIDPKTLFLLNDQGIAFQTWRRFSELDWARRHLVICAEIAALINEEREGVGAAEPLHEHKKAWAKFAHDNALHGISAPLCMWGAIAGASVYAYTVRLAPFEYCLEVWLRFERPLGLGLLIQPKRTVDRVKELFGSADHPLGDPIFDEIFLVRVSDPTQAEELLDAELRERLLAVHTTVGALSLTDDGLSVRLPAVPVDPGVVPDTVRHLLSLATSIAKQRGQQRQAGPYR